MKIWQSLRRRLLALPLFAKLWWATGLVLGIGFLATRSDGCWSFFFAFFLVLWVVPTVLWYAFRLWIYLTYRIGVRLFISYLLIGVLPLFLIVVVLALGGYLVIGQYASSGHGDDMERVSEAMTYLAEDALDAARQGGPAAARALLERGPRLPEELRQVGARVEWILASGGRVWHTPGAVDVAAPDWAEAGVETGPYWDESVPIGMLATVGRQDDTVVVLAVLLDSKTAQAFSKDRWYALEFGRARIDDDDGDGEGEDGESGEKGDGETSLSLDLGDRRIEVIRPQAPDEAETGADADEEASPAETRGFLSDVWNSRRIWFTRFGSQWRSWQTGKWLGGQNLNTTIRTSPREAATDLFTVPSEFRDVMKVGFVVLCTTFFVIYVIAVLLAAYYIFTITRAAARLTRGARLVQEGDLAYRIPVKARDQLGDLAVAFNQMTESVAGMLDEVAEKERLKNELELAREIQQSLLPSRELRHGSIQVHAYFLPAAEVGGDYFDLFPMDHGRLIVAVGDVAGHGLPTGLLMAMVKSAVATLIREGHRGVEILERVNQFMLDQPREHRMVTLAVAEIDVEQGIAEITNAAHPPVYLLGGSVQEILLPALPVGYPWRKPPPTERLELEAESRLVFYSDGLVEAANAEEEQFGYEKLRGLLEEHAELDSEALMARILKELEEYTAGRPLDDDLTLLIIDCGVGGEKEDSPSP